MLMCIERLASPKNWGVGVGVVLQLYSYGCTCRLKQAVHRLHEVGAVRLKKVHGTCKYAFSDYRKNSWILF